MKHLIYVTNKPLLRFIVICIMNMYASHMIIIVYKLYLMNEIVNRKTVIYS